MATVSGILYVLALLLAPTHGLIAKVVRPRLGWRTGPQAG